MPHRHATAHPMRGYREAVQMTQREVAARLGVARQTLAAWESGASRPDAAILVALARLYRVHATDFSETGREG